MKRLLLLPLLLAACATAPQLEPADSPDQARAVEVIESITGMEFKGPVAVYHFAPGTIFSEDYSEDSPSGEVLGFYDTQAKHLYLTRDAVGADWYFGLRIHEATHALQDQHYDLDALDAATTNSDEYLALQALIEGHAESVMADAMGAAADKLIYNLDKPADQGADEAPAAADVLYAFEYGVGLRFVRWLKAGGGYVAVDAAFRNPPASTEQVLHPDKYLRELPDQIEVDMKALQAALPGWELGEPDRRGELGVLTTLVVSGESDAAVKAASGWGGDVAVEAKRDSKSVTIWLTTWDTERDAMEYYSAARKLPDAQVWLDTARPRIVITVLGQGVKLTQVAPTLRKAKIAFHATP